MDIRFEHLAQLFDYAQQTHGDRPFLGTLSGTVYTYQSYSAFFEQVEKLQSRLDVDHGDVVAIIANNSPAWATVVFAVLSRGAAICPMYPAQKSEEWRHIIDDCGANLVVCENDQIANQLSDFDTFTLWKNAEELHELAGDHKGSEPAQISPEDLAFILYTSGTTNVPKGVPLTHRNVCATLNHAAPQVELRPTDRSLSFLPWAHSFGLIAELLTMVRAGGSLALAQSVATIIPNLAIAQPTVLFSVPRVFTQFYNAMQKRAIAEGKMSKKLFDVAVGETQRRGIFASARRAMFDKKIIAGVHEKFGGRLRTAFSGGAALSPEVAAFMQRVGVNVYEGYGLTETAALVTCTRPGAIRLGSAGKPLPNVDIQLRPVEDHPVTVGEIVVRGANVMSGYHNHPADPEVIDDDGFFHTGDLGRFDDDGFLWIVGRKKEQYKLSTGKYVVPAPIEETLSESPLVQHVLLVGHNQPYNVALVTPDPDYAAQADDPEYTFAVLASFAELTSELRTFELPKKVVVIRDPFTPENGMLTPSRKPKRRVVVEKYKRLIDDAFAAS